VLTAGGLAIAGGTVVTLDPLSFSQRDVLLGAEPRRRLDASGCLVMPGLVNAHTHLYAALARGMPEPSGPTRSFREILERVWWRLDAALDERSLRASAEEALLDAALSGATAVIDHHESPSFIEGSLDVLAEAARAVGVNVALCYGATDRHGPAGAKAGLAECERAIAAGLPAMVGLHAGFTVSDETLRAAVDLMQRKGAWLHVHAAEDRCDAESFARLDRAGALGPRTLLAHGVHLSGAERERAGEAGAWIAHNPRSNLQNAAGYADVRTLGARVALGTDGMDADLFTEARVAHLRAREAYGPAGGIDAVALLARSQHLADAALGRRPGDWIVLDYDPPTALTEASLAEHVLFGLGTRHVRDVIVNGEAIVEGRRPTRVDAAAVHARAREEAARLWERMA
jgi:cytosine/adenosine deaminase-related metal-dependent hydrolase